MRGAVDLHRAASAAAVVVALGWDKLLIALAVIGSMTYLAAIGKLDPAAPVGVMTAIMGYVFGASAPATTQAAHDVASSAAENVIRDAGRAPK
jgi:hypothetical protein